MATRNQILAKQTEIQQQMADETARHNEKTESIARNQNVLGWANFGASLLGIAVPVLGGFLTTSLKVAGDKAINKSRVDEESRHNKEMERLSSERNRLTEEANKRSTYAGGIAGVLGSVLKGAAGATTVKYLLDQHNENKNGGGPGASATTKGDALLKKAGVSFSEPQSVTPLLDQYFPSRSTSSSGASAQSTVDNRSLSKRFSDWRDAQPSFRLSGVRNSSGLGAAAATSFSLVTPLLFAL